MRVTYNFEHESRLKAAFIGCGGHSYRNVYPVFQYAPVDLRAVCDLSDEKAQAYARQFGGLRTYTNHLDMLEKEDLDCVFIVTGYDHANGARLLHPQLASDCLRAGVNAWIEKPPVSSRQEVDQLRKDMTDSGKQLGVGFKKAFTPANWRARAIIDSEEFGELQTLSLRYPQPIPRPEDLLAPEDEFNMLRLMFLDHLGHPLSALQLLGGTAASVYYTRTETGTGFLNLNMHSGAVACIHLTSGGSQRAMAERTEVSGDGGTVIVENNSRVTWCQSPYGDMFAMMQKLDGGDFARMMQSGGEDSMISRYGRDPDFTSVEEDAAKVWEPEFSLGNLYNKGMFILGYYNEIAYFCDAVLNDKPVDIGGIDYAEEGIKIYDAFKQGPNKLIEL